MFTKNKKVYRIAVLLLLLSCFHLFFNLKKNHHKKKLQARRLADQALASFLTIQAALRRSTRLRELTSRSDVQERLPGFAVRMGFGLHVGWAIEGAIGSEYKIDASYLSPNVNMASRLEAATKQFGTSLLMSGDFARLLSPGVRARTRQVRLFFFRKRELEVKVDGEVEVEIEFFF